MKLTSNQLKALLFFAGVSQDRGSQHINGMKVLVRRGLVKETIDGYSVKSELTEAGIAEVRKYCPDFTVKQ